LADVCFAGATYPRSSIEGCVEDEYAEFLAGEMVSESCEESTDGRERCYVCDHAPHGWNLVVGRGIEVTDCG
jgi:hypothetical protein